jgi:hypothetical protein
MSPRASVFGLVFAIAACSSFQDAPPSATDGGATLDGGDDAALSRGCAGHADDLAHFCDDFDEGTAVDFRWTSETSDPETTLSTSPTAYSGNSALRVAFSDLAAAGAGAFLHRKRDSSLSLVDKSRFKLTYMFKVVDAPFPLTQGYVSTTVVQFDATTCSGNNFRQIELTFFETGALRLTMKGFQEGCDGSNNAIFEQITMPREIAYFKDDFRRVSFEIKRGACMGTTGAASIVGEVDGITTSCKTLMVDPFANAKEFGLSVGAYVGNAGMPKTTFLYDDVMFDVD